MWHPDGRQAQRVGEHFVRQRAAEVRQYRSLFARGLLERRDRPRDPRIVRIQTRGRRTALDRQIDHREAVRIQMGAQVLGEVLPIGAYDEAQLAVRKGGRRNRVDRVVRVARLEGEHFKAVPAEDSFRGREARFAPVIVDGGVARATTDGDIGQRPPHRLGNRRRTQAVDGDYAACIDKAR